MLSRVFYVDSVKVWGCPRCPKRWVGPLLVYSVGCLAGASRVGALPACFAQRRTVEG